MATQSQGIQQLIAAEKKASERVTDARKRRQKRLKQARDEAATEITKFKADRQAKFQEFETKYLGDREGIEQRINTETNVKLTEMEKIIRDHKDRVMNDILTRVVWEVDPKLNQNVRLNDMDDDD